MPIRVRGWAPRGRRPEMSASSLCACDFADSYWDGSLCWTRGRKGWAGIGEGARRGGSWPSPDSGRVRLETCPTELGLGAAPCLPLGGWVSQRPTWEPEQDLHPPPQISPPSAPLSLPACFCCQAHAAPSPGVPLSPGPKRLRLPCPSVHAVTLAPSTSMPCGAVAPTLTGTRVAGRGIPKMD